MPLWNYDDSRKAGLDDETVYEAIEDEREADALARYSLEHQTEALGK